MTSQTDQKPPEMEKALELNILELNDYALLEILSHLSESDLLSIATTCTQLQRLAHDQFNRTVHFRKLNIIQFLAKNPPQDEQLKLTRYLQEFGGSIGEIDFSYDDQHIRQQYNASQHNALAKRNQWIFDLITKYCRESLKCLRMSNVYMFFQSNQMIRSQPLFNNLHTIAMNRCYKFLYDKKRVYRQCLTENCQCDLLNQENNLILVFCTSNILINLCLSATLERLTIKHCSLRDPFMKGFERFWNLRYLHMGFLNKFQMQYFWSLDNFGEVREFILDQRNFKTYFNAVAFDEFENFVKCMPKLEVFGLYVQVGDGDSGDTEWNVDFYMRLVDIYRARANKLLIKYFYFTNIDNLGISWQLYVKNVNFVEICKINDNDH